MKQKLWTSFLFAVSINFLVKPIWIFGVDLTIQNIIGSKQYGTYFSLLSVSLIFNIVLDIGTTNFNTKNIAQFKHLLKKYFKNIVQLKLFLGIIYYISVFILAYFLGYSNYELKLLSWLCFNQFLLSFILYFRSNISALQKFILDGFFSVLDKILAIVFCIILIAYYPENLSISSFIFCQTLSYVVSFVIISFLQIYWNGNPIGSVNLPFQITILKQSWPYAVLVLLTSIYLRIDSVMIERMLPNGNFESGIYAQSYRIVDALSIVGYIFASILLPLLSKMLVQKQNIYSIIRLAFKILVIPSIIFSITTSFHSSSIISYLYTDANHHSQYIFTILIFCFILTSGYYVFSTVLTANGNIMLLNKIALAGIVINIVLNFFLIPVYKGLGASMATLITQAFTVFFHGYFVSNFFNIQINLRKYVKPMVFILLLIAINLIIQKTEIVDISWIYKYTIGLGLGLILAAVLNLINIKEVLAFKKQD